MNAFDLAEVAGIASMLKYNLIVVAVDKSILSKGLVPFTQLVKVRRGKLVLALPSIRFS